MEATHLIKESYGYCYRIRVPLKLQPTIGLTEVKYSLKTGSIREATKKAKQISANIKYLFKTLKKTDRPTTMTHKEIKNHIAEYVRKVIDDSEERIADETGFVSPDDMSYQLNLIDDFKAEYQEALASHDYRPAYNSVDRLIEAKGLDIKKGSKEYRNMCHEMLIAKIQFMDMQAKQLMGDYSYREIMSTNTEAYSSRESNLNSITLANLTKEYWNEQSPNWKPRTITEHKIFNGSLIEFIGSETQVATISYQTGRDYKTQLKTKQGRAGKLISDKRVNMYLGYSSAVFNYAKRHNYIKDNPFEGLQIRSKKVRADKLRDIFTTDDLKLMFCESKEYGRDKCQHEHNFWMPLLALFTGCRLEELCQLRVSDIRTYEDTGIWYLDINQEQTRKSVKTAEERQVPLHPFIIEDLKFLSYINSLTSNNSRVFPKLKYINNRFGHAVGQWFSRFKKKAGIVAEPNTKVFHSFRHNLSTNLKYNMVTTEMIDEITGHATQGEQSRYGKRYTVPQLYAEAILKLNYNLDLSHLKKSKYVIR